MSKISNKFKIIEVFNPKAKNINEKMKEVFITYLTEKITNTENKTEKKERKQYIYKDSRQDIE